MSCIQLLNALFYTSSPFNPHILPLWVHSYHHHNFAYKEIGFFSKRLRNLPKLARSSDLESDLFDSDAPKITLPGRRRDNP